VQLSTEFCQVLETMHLQHIRYDQLKKIRSQLARCLFFFLPAKAYMGNASRPWSITVTNLLRMIDRPVPKLLSQRRALFMGKKPRLSVVDELDGKETLAAILGVRFALTSEKDDYKLECWLDARPEPVPVVAEKIGELHRIFLEIGGSEADFQRRLSRRQPLGAEHFGNLTDARVEVEACITFLEQAYAVLDYDEFTGALAEVADCVRTNRIIDGQPIKNPTGYLINYIIRTLQRMKLSTKAPAANPAPPAAAKPRATTPQTNAQAEADAKVQNYLANLSAEERDALEGQIRQQANEFDRRLLEERGDSYRSSLVFHHVRSKMGLS